MAPPSRLTVRSPDFAGDIPARFTCDGGDALPTLTWDHGPEGTASFAVIADDPDAPRAHFVHWLVWNIPSHVREITASTAGSYPQGTNGFGRVGWGGRALRTRMGPIATCSACTPSVVSSISRRAPPAARWRGR
jgi:phosphatidylethanolamine-binding protein (PEBP) family uncharacterized protein